MAAQCWMPLPSLARSEEHTSELQSQSNLVCRLLLEKKKQQNCLKGESSRKRPVKSISCENRPQALQFGTSSPYTTVGSKIVRVGAMEYYAPGYSDE